MTFSSLKLAGVLLLLAGCSTVGDACQFNYSDDLKEKFVLPTLKDAVGPEMIPFFNVDKPVITDKGKVSRVVLSPINRVDGRMVMYENSYVFIFDNCTDALVDQFKVQRN